MSNLADDLRVFYDYHIKQGRKPRTVIVAPELKEKTEAIVKELQIPVRVETIKN